MTLEVKLDERNLVWVLFGGEWSIIGRVQEYTVRIDHTYELFWMAYAAGEAFNETGRGRTIWIEIGEPREEKHESAQDLLIWATSEIDEHWR